MQGELGNMDQLRRLWSYSLLLHRPFLLLLIIINSAGTIYGFIWYAAQLEFTWNHYSPWLVLFVPDSPTASLFFTLAITYLWFNLKKGNDEKRKKHPVVMGIIESMAVITSIKYGVWAVVMIFAGAWQGSPIVWQQWMLVVSHLGMALEAILYARSFVFGGLSILIVSIWTILNDVIDYSLGVFPWLPKELHPYLHWIAVYTFMMSLISIAITIFLYRYNQIRNKSSV